MTRTVNPTNPPDGERLRNFIAEIERTDADIGRLTADRAELYRAAKASGFLPKVVRRLVAERRRSAAEREEEDRLLDLYRAGLTRQPAPVEDVA